MVEFVYGKVRMLNAIVTSTSLIGLCETRPARWGNYFSCDGISILNLWAENLETLIATGVIDDGKVRAIVYDDKYGIIVDPRIQREWYYNKLCFTGASHVKAFHAKEMYDIVGDPDYEFEQFIDPVSYYAKRGEQYNPKTGMISRKTVPCERKLSGEWTIESAQDSIFVADEEYLEQHILKALNDES